MPPSSTVAAKRALVFFCATWVRLGVRVRIRVGFKATVEFCATWAGLGVRGGVGVRVEFSVRARARASIRVRARVRGRAHHEDELAATGDTHLIEHAADGGDLLR